LSYSPIRIIPQPKSRTTENALSELRLKAVPRFPLPHIPLNVVDAHQETTSAVGPHLIPRRRSIVINPMICKPGTRRNQWAQPGG
jgi:hypothetical protein